jgi:hypothetical protein
LWLVRIVALVNGPDGIVIVEKGEVPYYAAAISHHGGRLTKTGVVEGAKRGLRSRSSPDSKGPKRSALSCVDNE